MRLLLQAVIARQGFLAGRRSPETRYCAVAHDDEPPKPPDGSLMPEPPAAAAPAALGAPTAWVRQRGGGVNMLRARAVGSRKYTFHVLPCAKARPSPSPPPPQQQQQRVPNGHGKARSRSHVRATPLLLLQRKLNNERRTWFAPCRPWRREWQARCSPGCTCKQRWMCSASRLLQHD